MAAPRRPSWPTRQGYFRAANIDAKIDGGIGSGEAIKRVAGGAYDFGIADVGTLVEFNARNPDAAPRVVMLLFDTAAHAIVSLKRTGIAKTWPTCRAIAWSPANRTRPRASSRPSRG
ncbi:MAG: ABC transporter substrate-binding protein [Pseudomonadota bacterium]